VHEIVHFLGRENFVFPKYNAARPLAVAMDIVASLSCVESLTMLPQ
jgi:hypothetical protein